MKKAFGLVLALIIILLFSVSCGISQDKYDKVNSDLAAAQVQIQKLQSDITTKDATLKAANDKLAKAKNEIGVLNTIFIPAMAGELNNKTQSELMTVFLGWRDKVNTIGDPVLTAKFQAIVDTAGNEETTMAFFQYLLEDIARAVQ